MPPRSSTLPEPRTPPRRPPGDGGDGAAQQAGGAAAAPTQVPDRPFLRVGALIDAQDTVPKWHQAEVAAVDARRQRVYIHYIYYASRYDEWVAWDSDRLAPRGTHALVPGGTPRQGQLVDCLDEATQTWLESRVVGETPDAVRIKLRRGAGDGATHLDVWIPRDVAARRVAPFGSHTRKRVPFRPKGDMYWTAHRGHTAQLPHGGGAIVSVGANGDGGGGAAAAVDGAGQQQPAVDARVVHYLTALAARGMSVAPMGGDGNCLFRSVAHQVYGDERYHGVLRAATAAYMAAESDFFASFVVGDRADFDAYVARVATLGVWGDDPEIQALCELFDRPAEIWAYDPAAGAGKLRTFHAPRADTRPPIRLSYYGGGHYDSVVGPGWQANLLPATEAAPAGTVETAAVEAARRRTAPGALGASLRDSDAAATEAAALADVLARSRDEYDGADTSLDVAMLMSLGVDPFAAPHTAAAGTAGPAAAAAAGAGGAAAAAPPPLQLDGGSAAATTAAAAAAPTVTAPSAPATAPATAPVLATAAPAAGAQALPSSLPPVPQPTLEADLVSRALAASAAEADASQARLLAVLQAQHEEEQLRAALAASLGGGGVGSGAAAAAGLGDAMDVDGAVAAAAVDEEGDLERALAMSLAAGGGSGGGASSSPGGGRDGGGGGGAGPIVAGDADRLLSMAMDMTEEEQLAMLLSMGSGNGAGR
jgi:hypothetical protein